MLWLFLTVGLMALASFLVTLLAGMFELPLPVYPGNVPAWLAKASGWTALVGFAGAALAFVAGYRKGGILGLFIGAGAVLGLIAGWMTHRAAALLSGLLKLKDINKK